jgi:hypothetical protein
MIRKFKVLARKLLRPASSSGGASASGSRPGAWWVPPWIG